MRGGGRGPVGVKCCAANSNLPPRRADPHAEGKTLWDKTPPRSAVFRVDPPLPSLPCSSRTPPPRSPSVTREGHGHSGWGGRGPPERGLWGLVGLIARADLGSISGRSRVDLGSRGARVDRGQGRSWVDLAISGRSRVDLGSISGQSRVDLGSISGRSRVDLGSCTLCSPRVMVLLVILGSCEAPPVRVGYGLEAGQRCCDRVFEV